VKGAATLYSKEYFEAVKAHLNPGGLVTQWVPLYESDFDTVRSEVATFLDVFPNAIVWGNLDIFDRGYDVVLMGSVEPIRVDLEAYARRVAADPRIVASLKDVGFRSGFDLLGVYTAQGRDLAGWLKGAQMNRDLSLRLQFLAGMSVSQGKADFIYAEMERRGAFPAEIFRGSAEDVAEVRKAFEAWRAFP
jgi:spermidine synthase